MTLSLVAYLLVTTALAREKAVLAPAPSPSARAALSQRFAQDLAAQAATVLVGCHGTLESPSEEACAKEEEVMRLGKRLYIDSHKEFERVVLAELERIRGARSYNYLAILLATLSRDPALIPPLEKVAKTEASAGVRNRYAAAALERLRTGKCDPTRAKQPELEELCTYEDADFERLRHYPDSGRP